mmetsp:Transcript_29865/g.85521  ORF Transcript_29865/g.85521 Transcript_29865/m.85521 type:complete len:257 (+) Transcript_29865:443-1213(+)
MPGLPQGALEAAAALRRRHGLRAADAVPSRLLLPPPPPRDLLLPLREWECPGPLLPLHRLPCVLSAVLPVGQAVPHLALRGHDLPLPCERDAVAPGDDAKRALCPRLVSGQQLRGAAEARESGQRGQRQAEGLRASHGDAEDAHGGGARPEGLLPGCHRLLRHRRLCVSHRLDTVGCQRRRGVQQADDHSPRQAGARADLRQVGVPPHSRHVELRLRELHRLASSTEPRLHGDGPGQKPADHRRHEVVHEPGDDEP